MSKVQTTFSCRSAEVLGLMGQAVSQRRDNLVQAYADLMSAAIAVGILLEQDQATMHGHMTLAHGPFFLRINEDRDGLASTLGLSRK
jgi:hypothetical protein